MSSGPFVNTRYESSEISAIMRIRVQPETLALFVNGESNSAPTDPIDVPLFAYVSASRNEYGVRPRSVVVRFTDEPPTGYSGDNITLPVLREAAYAAYTPGAVGTYLGAPVEIFSRRCETAK